MRPPTQEHLPHLLALAGLHFSLTQWPLASFPLLTSDSVLVSPEAVSRLASRHSVSSSRVLGSLYKRHAPARHPGTPHHIREELGTRLCVHCAVDIFRPDIVLTRLVIENAKRKKMPG